MIGTIKKDVECRLTKLNRASESVGLRIIRSKTKWIEYFKTNERICLGNAETEQVQKYIYLGQTISQEHQQGLTGEIGRRIKAVWCAFNSISDVLKKLTDVEKRAQLFNSTVLPALVYGCETWTLSTSLANRLRSTLHTMAKNTRSHHVGLQKNSCRNPLHRSNRRGKTSKTLMGRSCRETRKRPMVSCSHKLESQQKAAAKMG